MKVSRMVSLLMLFAHRLKTQVLYRLFFVNIGNKTTIYKNCLLIGTERISLGARIIIRDGTRLETVGEGGVAITIGDDTNIEQGCHIVARNLVEIGRGVSITARVAIVDVTHPIMPGTGPVGQLVQEDANTVEIGDNCFIGIGSVILPGTRLGRGVIVGANSVVSGTHPDGSVIAGAPAKKLRVR